MKTIIKKLQSLILRKTSESRSGKTRPRNRAEDLFDEGYMKQRLKELEEVLSITVKK